MMSRGPAGVRSQSGVRQLAQLDAKLIGAWADSAPGRPRGSHLTGRVAFLSSTG